MNLGKEHFIGSLAIIFFAALGLRFLYFSAARAGPLGNVDSAEYEALASSFTEHKPYGGAIGIGGFPSDLQRPPGYPFFLAFVRSNFGIGRTHVAVVQCVLDSLFTTLLVIAGSFLINEFAGLVAGIVYATDWATIIYTPSTLADSLLAVILGAAICLQAFAVQRRSSYLSLSAGLFLGLAVLVKPVGQVVVIAFLLAWILQRDRRAASLLFLVTYIACVGPWMARNYLRYGLATVSTISTTNLFLYTAEASAHPHSIADISSSGLDEDLGGINIQWRSFALSPPERELRMEHEALSLIRQHWPTMIWQAGIGFTRTCLGTGLVTVRQSFSHPLGRSGTVLLSGLAFVQIIALWLLASIAFVGESSTLNRAVLVLLGLCVLCLVLPAASSVGQSRFRVPAAPPLSLLAGVGAAVLRERKIKSTLGAHRFRSSSIGMKSLRFRGKKTKSRCLTAATDLWRVLRVREDEIGLMEAKIERPGGFANFSPGREKQYRQALRCARFRNSPRSQPMPADKS